MAIGYARVSTTDQNLDAQTDALTTASAERLFSERVSGAKAERPELDKMLDQLRDGDVVVVTKHDRLARSLRDLLDIVEAIKEHGAGFRSLAEDIDTTTPAGELIFHVFASSAHFERRRISERTREGLAAARKRGRIGGSPPALTPDQKTEVIRMRDEEKLPLREIASLFQVSTQTVWRA
ncbi:MAG: recombinase family protein [Pseudomonadota bacterium]